MASSSAAAFFMILLLGALVAQASAAKCDTTANMGKLLSCQAAAVKNGKNPKTLKGCCDAIKPFAGSRDAADCLCQSLIAAKQFDRNVDLSTAVGIPAKCGMAVLPGLKCNGISIPQH